MDIYGSRILISNSANVFSCLGNDCDVTWHDIIKERKWDLIEEQKPCDIPPLKFKR